MQQKKRMEPPCGLGFTPAMRLAGILFAIALLTGCGRLFEDNGTHLAYALERASAKMRLSGTKEMVVRYVTLDAPAQGYYIEFTPSIHESGQRPDLWHSYLVVSGQRSGGTSYHNRFVFVPARLFLHKDDGGPAEIALQRDGDRINIVALR